MIIISIALHRARDGPSLRIPFNNYRRGIVMLYIKNTCHKRNSSTLLFGGDQLHLEANKNNFAIVHDFLHQSDPLVNLCEACLNAFSKQCKKIIF